MPDPGCNPSRKIGSMIEPNPRKLLHLVMPIDPHGIARGKRLPGRAAVAWKVCNNFALFVRAEEALRSVLRALSTFQHLNHLAAISPLPQLRRNVTIAATSSGLACASLLAHAILFAGLRERIPTATFSTNQTKDTPAECSPKNRDLRSRWQK
jgi:hypothetical protein